MRLFDIILFISLLAIAFVQYWFGFIGGYGLIVLLAIALVGFLPLRMVTLKSRKVKLALQRIAGKTER